MYNLKTILQKRLYSNKFNKNKPSFYKLTSNQIQQLLKYLKDDFSQEELNNAIGYTYTCPYCKSKDIYKTDHKSNLYKFKCETCNKQFTNLSKNVIAYLLKEEYINRNRRFMYKKSLENIEVWLCFDNKLTKNYHNIPRNNEISNIFRWKHNMLQIPKDLKKDHLVNIYEYDEESSHGLLDIKEQNNYSKKFINENKKFIILTFKEGKFMQKKSINDFANKLMKVDNSPLESYQNNIKNIKVQQEYEILKNTLIQSYNDNCETLTLPNINDKIYEDIKIPHKHTYLLAYEMAIRSLEVKKILYALKYLKKIKNYLQVITNKYYKDKDSSITIARKAAEVYNKNIETCKRKLLEQYPCYLTDNLHEKYLSIGFYELKSMIDDFEEELRKEYLIIPKENEIVTPESKRILIQRCTYNSIDGNKYKWHPSYQQEMKYNFEEKEYSEYTTSMGIFKGNDLFDVNAIRPTFNLHIIDKNSSYIPINFTMPTEEIIAFINLIKDDLKKDKNIIKSPTELLGEELQTIEEAEAKQYLPKTFKQNLISMSNALFTYDMFQYLTHKQTKLEIKKRNLDQRLHSELSIYKTPGPNTTIMKNKKKKIEAKYSNQILELTKEIQNIGKTSKSKYEKIISVIDVSESNVQRYISFMTQYIEEKKYIKLISKHLSK